MEISFDRHFQYKDILQAVTPAVLMMIVTSIYSIIDGYFVSNYVGTTAFAAINLVTPVAMLIGATGFMVGTGGSALIAKTLGRKKEENANRIFSMLLQFLLSIGIPLSFILFFFAKEICQLLGAEEDLLADSIVYTRFLAISLPAFMLQIVFQSFYMVAGRPLLGTIMSVVCGVANVLLDLLFVVHAYPVLSVCTAPAAPSGAGLKRQKYCSIPRRVPQAGISSAGASALVKSVGNRRIAKKFFGQILQLQFNVLSCIMKNTLQGNICPQTADKAPIQKEEQQ